MTFQIALTGDFQKDGEAVYPDFNLGQLKAASGIKYSFFTEHKSEIDPEVFDRPSFQEKWKVLSV